MPFNFHRTWLLLETEMVLGNQWGLILPWHGKQRWGGGFQFVSFPEAQTLSMAPYDLGKMEVRSRTGQGELETIGWQ